ncbi:hypothetical protein D9M71_784710 [compost metagenome]
MSDGHSAIFLQEHNCQWLAHDVGTTQNHSMLARQIVSQMLFGENYAPLRCAWHEWAAFSTHQTSGIGDMESINILMSRDAGDNSRGVDMTWQRQLNQNAVNSWIII